MALLHSPRRLAVHTEWGAPTMEVMGVEAFAKRVPSKTALVDGERSVSFAELDGRMNQLARVLHRQGVGAGDRIASAVSNRVEWFEVAGAAARVGATVVPVSWRNMHDEVAYLVKDSEAKLIFAEPDAADVMAGLPAVFVGAQYEGMLRAETDVPLEASVERPLIGFRYYTSGTTGQPKAIEGEMPTGERLVALSGRKAQVGPGSDRRSGGRRRSPPASRTGVPYGAGNVRQSRPQLRADGRRHASFRRGGVPAAHAGPPRYLEPYGAD